MAPAASLGWMRHQLRAFTGRPTDAYLRAWCHLPRGHEHVVRNVDGSLTLMWALDGAPYECEPFGAIADAHERLCRALLDLNRVPRLTQTAHLVRAEARPSAVPVPAFHEPFVQQLAASIRRRLIEGGALYENALFASITARPAGVGAGREAPRDPVLPDKGTLDALLYAAGVIEKELGRSHGVARLGVRAHDGVLFSEVAEAMGLILSGERRDVPLPAGRLSRVILPERPVFKWGGDVELWGDAGPRAAALFGFNAHPEHVHAGMFDALMRANYRHSLNQSFTHTEAHWAQQRAGRAWTRFVAADDPAAEQAEDLRRSRGELVARNYGMGVHNATLIAFADTREGLPSVAKAAADDVRGSGAQVSRLTFDHEAAYWGALPGADALPGRAVPWKTRCFAAAAPFRGHRHGWRGGRWCDHVAVFQCTSGEPFYWNPHTNEQGRPGQVPHVLFTGPTGSGKTTALGALLALLRELAGSEVFLYDKDRGLKILTLRVGGTYIEIRMGQSTGLAPLKALDGRDAGDRAFLIALVRALIEHDSRPGADRHAGYRIPPRYDARIALAVDTVMSMPAHLRSFGEIMAFLGTDADGPGARLRRWVRGLGDLGWVLDCEDDRVAPALDAGWVAFDQTEYLKHADARGPIQSYLFHVVGKRVDGRRIVVAADEIQESFKDPAFRPMVANATATFRKLEGAFWLATQDVDTLVNVPEIAAILRTNCLTHFHYPNGSAVRAQYETMGVSPDAFPWVRDGVRLGLPKGGFLLRQGDKFTPLYWSLEGMDEVIATLSGEAEEVKLLDEVMAEFGPSREGEAWPEWHRRRVSPEFRRRQMAAWAARARENEQREQAARLGRERPVQAAGAA